MKEVKGDIWDCHDRGHWIVITTNSVVNSSRAVMGKGIALEAKERFSELPILLGEKLTRWGNHVYLFRPPIRLITFPTKEDWRLNSLPTLIAQSAFELMMMWKGSIRQPTIYMPRPGCGNGGLDWKDVKPILERYLDDRFVVVTRYV